ncbi:MAG: hypothetical protein ABIN97_14695 [Ginsengibacter sp.]
MKKQLLYLLLLLCSIASYSCNSTKILSATFESDVISSAPATNLVGEPTGDVITYNAAIEPQLRVQNSETAGEKALHFINAALAGEPISGHNRWVGFRGIGTNLINTLWFTHTAKNVLPTGDLLIDVSDGNGNVMARMRIRANGEVGLARNIQDIYTDVIGNLGQNGHTIIFTTMPSELKYNVTIFRTGAAAITALNKPMVTENVLSFANPAHPTISFQYPVSPSGTQKYIIESVLISRRNPN